MRHILKLVKRRIPALILVLFLCGTALAGAEAVDSLFAGHWEDRTSERAWMRIDRNRDGDYDVRIHWGSGIYEGDEWSMTGIYDPETVSLVYSDGSHTTCFYDDDGQLTGIRTHYEEARGVIYFDEGDFLRFDTDDEALLDCQFEWIGA